ncbi:MAG: hypothetical protein HOO06_16765 [Bdellovibrionaceae bacterium]|nr:hypothetical protein [Pseudobdellovibrionaceae bacterium]
MIKRNCENCKFNSYGETWIKCCDYFPFIPNFLVGYGLTKNYSFWRWLLAQQDILKQPLGLVASAKLRKDLKSPPHIDKINKCYCYNSSSGKCQIWEYRPKYCESYFCNITDVESSQLLGSGDLKVDKEMEHAQFVLLDKGLINQEIQLCLGDYNSGLQSETVNQMFSSLANAPEEFYLDCHLRRRS